MKKSIFILILSLFIACQSQAQQPKAKHMVITIVNTRALIIGKTNNMFITRDDTAQVQKIVDLNPHAKSRDKAAAYEELLMKLIAPYYAQGWKLVTTSIDDETDTANDISTKTYRYYFVKDE